MKGKLLSALCVALGASVLVKLALVMSPWNIRVPSDFMRWVNALMLLSGGLALSLGISTLVERIPWSRVTRKQVIAFAAITAVATIIVLGIAVAVHSSRRGDIFGQVAPPQVTWDNQPADATRSPVPVGIPPPPAGFTSESQRLQRDIIQEAVGKKPPDPSRPSEEKKTVALLADVLRTVADLKSQHHAEAAPYMQGIVTLYSPSSFSSRSEMERLIKAVAGLNEVDRQFDRKLHDFPRQVQSKLNASDLSDPGKNEFLSGFNEGFAPTLKATDDLQVAEDKWAGKTLELYRFASQHANRIRIEQGQVAIADDNLRSQFNAQLSSCLDWYSKLQIVNARLVVIQKASTQKSGITDEDLGVKK